MTHRVAIAMVIVLAAALRFWNIGAGLPYRVGPDEPVIAERAINMMRTGDFHPHFWDYPGFYIYFQLFIGCIRFVTGAMAGLFSNVADFYPEHMFLWTRLTNAAFGTVTVALLYGAAQRWGPPTAIVAAAILAVWPNHVRESHFALTDIPLTMFTTAALFASLRAFETWRLRWFVAAGCAAGLAGATKYGGALAIIMPLMSVGLSQVWLSHRLKAAGLVAAAAILSFLAAAPYTLLDLPGFLNGFGRLSGYYQPAPFREGAETYLFHVRVAVGWGGLLLTVGGILWGTVLAFRDGRLRLWSMALVFPLVYFHSIATKSLVFGRYLLPVVPFLALFMAIGAVGLTQAIWVRPVKLWVRTASFGVAAAAMLAPVFVSGIAWPAQFGRRSTVDVAYEKILDVIPEGSGVVIERSVLRLPDSRYRKQDVHTLAIQSPAEFSASGITYAVASSEAFGRIIERPEKHKGAYDVYQSIFSAPGHCLPAIQPSASLPGPKIIICRLDGPIQ